MIGSLTTYAYTVLDEVWFCSSMFKLGAVALTLATAGWGGAGMGAWASC